MDVDACVKRVRILTGGKQLVLSGHSTGGRVIYEYLQGVTLDVSKFTDDVVPHVVANPAVAKERNQAVKGLLLLDPGSIPPLPAIINQYAVWKATGSKVYLDIDGFMVNVVNPYLKYTNVITVAVETLFGAVDYLADLYATVPDNLYSEELDIFRYLNVWLVQNTDAHVEDYFARYCAGSTYMRALTEFGDNSLNNANREHWKNGEENKDLVEGPAPDRGNDGYYYYDDPVSMSFITVPAFAIFSDEGALVDSNEVIAHLFKQKTKHALDNWLIVKDTAHLDVVAGYKSPTVVFPAAGKWLASLESFTAGTNANNDQVAVVNNETTANNDQTENGNYNSINSGSTGCGSSAFANTSGVSSTSGSSGFELLIITALVFYAGRFRKTRRI